MKKQKEPKYLQLKEILKKQILSGDFSEGDRFHTQSEIANSFQVSSITAIRALDELKKEGLVERKQGIGTFVARSRREVLVKFSDIELFCPNQENVQVLSITKGNNPYYLEKLNLHKTEYYYQITRLRTAAEKPFIYHQTYLPHDFIKNPNADLQAFQSIYNRFEEDFHITMTDQAFEETNEICLNIPTKIKKALQLNDFEPSVLQLRTTKNRESNRILEYIETYKHWEYFKFKISSND